MSDAIPYAEVRPDDQERWLGPPPWEYTPTLKAWEEAHGHDVRVKCYPEYGCLAIEAERDALLAENEALREALAPLVRQLDSWWSRVPDDLDVYTAPAGEHWGIDEAIRDEGWGPTYTIGDLRRARALLEER